nr:DnaJ protein erdj3b [Ipomoea batatas]
MGSKVDELSGETCVENASSFSGNDVLPASKSKKDFALEPKMEVSESLEDHVASLADKEGIDKVVGTTGLDLIASQIHQMEESDDSEIVEVDVKVCDICGDVGREYLLAICSRCTDGAEHTYCMQKMLEKIPEGDWLCEECKFDQEMKNKHANSGRVNEKEKTSPSRREIIAKSDHPLKMEQKTSDFWGDKAIEERSYLKTSGKRCTDDSEVSSPTKRQRLELRSPTAQIPNRVTSLSRESSFKNLEKKKVKLVNQLSYGSDFSSATMKRALEPILGSPKAQMQTKVPSLHRESSFKNLEKGKVKLVNPLPNESGVSSVAKKRALEPILCSPKAKIPNRVASLSHESSFKNLERGKVKPLNPFSSGSFAAKVPSSTAPQPQPPRGIFSKSNSFSSSSAKPKVKLVDQVSPVKQKSVRETAFINSKEGAVRSLGKSMSFKSPKSTQLNDVESKVKMLSPRSSHDRDMEGPKKVKDKSLCENSLRSEHTSCVAISSSRSDKKSSPHGDPSLQSTVKVTDSKLPGETKKQASHVDGASVSNRVKNNEEKPNQISTKGDSSSSSYIAVRTVCSSEKVVQDGLSQPMESKKCGQRARENSGSHSRQASTASGKNVSGQKGKGSGHAVQFSTVNGTELSLDAPAVKNSGEVTNWSGDVKAAIEAAMLKKPGKFWKNKVSDRIKDLLALNKNNDISFPDQLPSPSYRRNMKCSKETHEELKRLQQSTACSSKQETKNNAEQLILHSAEVPIGTGDAGPEAPSDGKSSRINVQSHSPVEKALLKATIPEHQYIWQGGFEIHRSGKTLILCDGIQAHLSTRASPKVLDAANKFPQKLMLNEISRLSYWPIQFQECGVREDNIALFFFPVDIESYEKSYKILLGDMMMHDLALKGNFGGIELLIFPSNQLPEKFHRWNMMFFLWGVFKGNKENCLHALGAEKLLTQDISRIILPLPDNLCDLGHIKNAAYGSTAENTEMPASKESESVSSYNMLTEKCGSQGSSQEEDIASDCRADAQHISAPTDERVRNPTMSGQLSVQCAATEAYRHQPLHCFREVPAAVQDVASVRSSLMESSDEDDVQLGDMPLADGSTNEEAALVREMMPSHSNMNLINRRADSVETVLQSAAPGTTHGLPNYSHDSLVSVHHNRKGKSLIDEFSGHNDQASHSSYGFLSGIHRAASVPSPQEKAHHEASSEMSILGRSGRAETFFFPVAPLPADEIGFDGSMMQRKVHPLEEDLLHDKAPNLELALVTEAKSITPSPPLFLAGNVGKKHELPTDDAATSVMEEEVSTSLSLSLSFPYPDKEQGSSSKTEPGRRHVNTTLFLF